MDMNVRMYRYAKRLMRLAGLMACLCLLLPCSLWAAGKDFIVVIDPGHGGHDPGAIGKRGKEKAINLNVALKTGRLIEQNCPGVKVMYTRSTDKFVALDRRAEIANNAKADLFISIHTNAVARGRSVRGTETYTLGLHRTEENLEVAKQENAVILIEQNYEQRYAGFNPNSAESYIIFEFLQDKNMAQSVQLATLIQRQFKTTARRIDKGVHQAGFLVLRATSMPSVLVELGYISNPEEERYLLTDAGTSALAKSIYQAFAAYHKEHQGSTGSPSPAAKPVRTAERTAPAPEDSPKPAKATAKPAKTATREANNPSAKPVFKIQILTSDRKLAQGHKRLKGLSPVGFYREKGIYKYTYGESTDYNKILRMKRQINAKFKDCFIIAFRNGEKMDVQEAIREFKQKR